MNRFTGNLKIKLSILLRRKLILFCFIFPSLSFAQATDSVVVKNKARFYVSKAIAPTGLIVAGILANGNGEESFKNEFEEGRDKYFANFHTHLDDYLQYA